MRLSLFAFFFGLALVLGACSQASHPYSDVPAGHSDAGGSRD